MPKIKLIRADCLRRMRSMEPDSVDTIITDPPYGLDFMGKAWDHGSPGPAFWKAALRVAKPGAFLLCFGGTRTFHRLAVSIEDAGWELRDCMMWVYGTGFPKGYNLGKKLPDFQGYNTALKPAWEPIIVAMKPLDGTFLKNAEKHGVAGFNIDATRIGFRNEADEKESKQKNRQDKRKRGAHGNYNPPGRFPPNVILDPTAAQLLDAQSGSTKSTGGQASLGAFRKGKVYGKGKDIREKKDPGYGDTGGASRFFYCAKASSSERGKGNNHPTVKPLKLMEYLCLLTRTPKGGIVLDPFMGSGTTGLACRNTKRSFIGIEKSKEYFKIARRRIRGK